MANLGMEYSVDELPQGSNFDPIPAGWYTAKITEATLTPTKAGNGEYIKLRFDVMGPTHEGRVIFSNLNIRNPNPKAEEIGRQQLGDLMRAIGLSRVTDTEQLIGGDCQVKVSIRRSEEYGDQNEVKAYKAIAGGAMPKASASSQSTPPQAESAATPPWKR